MQDRQLSEQADSLAARNAELNRQLQELICQIEEKVQTELQSRENEIVAMREKSFMQVGGLMGFVLLLLLISYIIIHRDAKSIKQYKHKTTDLIRQLEQSVQRNEALITSRKKAVHTITHELRTPLTAITGYAGLIRKEQCEDKSGQCLTSSAWTTARNSPVCHPAGFQQSRTHLKRSSCDIIVTNPPFSLFREFLAWIVAANKQFLIIGNMNAISYKEVFPLIKENKMWLGNGFKGGNAYFRPAGLREYANGVYNEETGLVKFRNCCWFTNIDHGRRHQPLSLMTMAENLKFSRHKEIKGRKDYIHYDNYDAIEVPYTDAIPSDYEGVMGVPLSFLDKYCPEQFEIIGQTQGDSGKELGLKPYPRELKKLNPSLRDGQLYYIENGRPEKPYARILIRKKIAYENRIKD